MTLKEITDEFTGKTYKVLDTCSSCKRSRLSLGREGISWVFNIKSGLLHAPDMVFDDTTLCGRDTTGKTWLHQL